MAFDRIYLVNFVLCATIFVFGIGGYRKKKDNLPLYVGIAFGIFGLTHLLTLLGFRKFLTDVFIIIRTIAYLLVVIVLYKNLKR